MTDLDLIQKQRAGVIQGHVLCGTAMAAETKLFKFCHKAATTWAFTRVWGKGGGGGGLSLAPSAKNAYTGLPPR